MSINSIHPASFDPLQREDIDDSIVPVNAPMEPAISTFIEVGGWRWQIAIDTLRSCFLYRHY